MTADIGRLLEQGIAAAKQGQKAQARELFLQVIELDDHSEKAWLWLSGVVEQPEDQLICLENVLTINPQHAAAIRGMEKLKAAHPRLVQPEPAPEPADLFPPEAPTLDWSQAAVPEIGMPAPTPSPTPAEEVDTQQCPHCGMVNPSWRSLCTACGQPMVTASSPAAVDEPDPAASIIPQDTRICVHCGAVNPQWRTLCESCGKQVSGRVGIAESTPLAPAEHYEPVEVNFMRDYDNPHPGLISIVAAWIAAMMFNKRGAYEYEIFSASSSRTIKGLLLGTLAVPVISILFSGLVLFLSGPGDIITNLVILFGIASSLILYIIPAAIGILVIFGFYAGTSYMVARMLGSKTSYIVHTQLISVAISASGLMTSIMSIITSALVVALADISVGKSFSLLDLLETGGIVSFILGAGSIGSILYSLAMQAQAISVAHRFSEWRSAATMILTVVAAAVVGALLGFIYIMLSL